MRGCGWSGALGPTRKSDRKERTVHADDPVSNVTVTWHCCTSPRDTEARQKLSCFMRMSAALPGFPQMCCLCLANACLTQPQPPELLATALVDFARHY